MLEHKKNFTRRDVLRVAGLIGLGAALSACGVDITPTPYFDNRPSYPPTPTYKDFASSAVWAKVLESFSPGLSSNLEIITKAIPDKQIRVLVAETLVNNAFASSPGKRLELSKKLIDSGRGIGGNFCGDSRVVCNTVFYSASEGSAIATSEKRALGAAPSVFNKGINVSILATHCNSIGDPSGCGALAGLAELENAGGYQKLRAHNISDDTIKLLQSSLRSPDPDIQAVAGAKIQALINANAHGTGHVAVAVRMGHADGSMQILGAYNELGQPVGVPDVVKEFVAFNSNSPIGVNSKDLSLGQAPPQFAMNSTRFNIQDLMGKQASTPGNTFKITVQSDTGGASKLLNVAEIDRGVAAIQYPMAHEKWGKLQWLFGRSPEELALMRERLMMNDGTWKYLANRGIIVEALVDDSGKITGTLRITNLSKLPEKIKAIEELKLLTPTTYEIVLSQKTLAEAKIVVDEAGAARGAKFAVVIEKLKELTKIGFKILKFVDPVFNAALIAGAFDVVKKINGWDGVYSSHSTEWTTDRKGKKATGDLNNGGALSTAEYQGLLKKYPHADPYMVSGRYGAIYTNDQLATSFHGLIKDYQLDVTQGGDTVNGSTNPSSKFYGVPVTDVERAGKILLFGYEEPATHVPKNYSKVGKPLIFLPLPNKTAYSSNHYEYTDDGIKKHTMVIYNPDTKEFISPHLPGEMIVPVESIAPLNEKVRVIYYLHLKSDGEGRIIINPVGYKEEQIKTSALPKSYFASSGSTKVDGLFGYVFPKKESVSVS